MNEQNTVVSHALAEAWINSDMDFDLYRETSSKTFVMSSGFAENWDRYYFDGILSYEQGWEQYDTSSDAWYFGIWVNIKTMQIIKYVEGDIYLQTYYNKCDFKDALNKMEEVYGEPPPAFITIDDSGNVSHFYDKRPSIT